MTRFGSIVALLAVSTTAYAEPVSPPAISVTGEATLSVEPDTAVIDAGVVSEAKTARDATETTNKKMGLVLLAVKSAGIPAKDTQTSQLSLSPVTAQNRASGESIQTVGYRANNRVTVTVHDLTLLSALIDSMTAAGANNIGGIGFAVSQRSKLLDDARAQALADARRKAEIYARVSDVSLGAPLSISENGGTAPVAFRQLAAAGMSSPTPIAQGEETLRVGVSVSYEIKPKAP
jgi:uncharacterized protein YggE